MNATPLHSDDSTAWRRQLYAALGCALFGVLVHLAGPVLPVQLATVGLAAGVIGAAFLLAWAADAGEAVFSGGLVLAGVALVTVLPEFIIETRFAYIQEADLVTANLTGATRLLLTGAVGMPLAVAFLAHRRQEAAARLQLAAPRRLELGILLIASIFTIQIGVSAAIVATIANPFADALLETGTSLGIDPYLLVQWIVPLSTEAPEFVVVAVLVASHRPAQGLALFLAASVSQWTLAMGALPFAYLAGGGGPAIVLSSRSQIELVLTIAVTLFAVAALASRRPERVDASLMLGLFAVEFSFPTPFVRVVIAVILLVFAIDLLCAHHRDVHALLRAAVGRTRAPG
jgi:cation:H+ antiporter